ncbi:hypothetical protein AWB78_07882 [Caballeronia calidae]|uniref:Uncharacterized protein n=1 Tax=Caballeronia calidae TaxID=1777139 RepID=A0A158EGV6_9BURK|nr:hypothetical protein [Caballeronia calidae]SAL06112.1 hypothetical protein AWB78_07882 [Caballeronia calidae]
MASNSHMAFARNAAGQVVAASDLPSVGPAIFHCAGCGCEVTLCRQDASQAYFRHARPVACELCALHALHAAALQLLAESRFVDAPALTQHGIGHGKRHMIEEWGEASVCTNVDGIPVDFFAETLAGPLVIQIAIKSGRSGRRVVLGDRRRETGRSALLDAKVVFLSRCALA